MNELTKVDNLIKWTLKTDPEGLSVQESRCFEIQDCKCAFMFHTGYKVDNEYRQPLSLSIIFKENTKLNAPVDITVQLITLSKTLSISRQTITGERQEMIWSSFDFSLRGTSLTFEMTIHGAGAEHDKYVQTPPYIDALFLVNGTSKDFEKLLDDDTYHDVEFAIGNHRIKAHRNILCCRSSVFRSMLQSNMVEGSTGQIKIEDIDITIFKTFLRFLYMGTAPELTVEIAVQLYIASDKYAVNTLKILCANFLTDNLSHENACEILLLADRCCDPELKKITLEYIFKEKIPVVWDKWADFCNEYQNLAIEVPNSFCQYLCKQ